MKKALISLSLSLFSLIISGNPVYVPDVYLDKFFFDNNKNWTIVLIVNIHSPIDSLIISSSSGKSVCKKQAGDLPDNAYRDNFGIEITNDSLNSKININPDGDSIAITAFYKRWDDLPHSTTESIVYGNYRNSIISKPLIGESIVRYSREGISFCKRDSLGNIGGTIHGHIYDKENNLITKGSFVLSPYLELIDCWDAMGGSGVDGIDINNDGTYSTTLYSLKYNRIAIGICNKIICKPGFYYSQTGTIPINPLTFTIEPNTSTEMDIHLLDDFVDIQKIENNTNELLKVFPNPINNTSFHYELSVPVKSTNCIIHLLNLNGQLVGSYNIDENIGELFLPENISNGSYLLQLKINEKEYASAPIIVNKK